MTLKPAPCIVEEFRDKATRYARGETIFLLDGSAAFEDARLDGAQAIDEIRGDLKSKVMTMIWGNDNGSVVVGSEDHARRVGNLENSLILPTLGEVQQCATFGVYRKPVHLLVASAGGFDDDADKVEAMLRGLMKLPGVFVDFMIGPEDDTKLSRVVKEIMKKEALVGGPDEPMRWTHLQDPGNLGVMMADMINARMFYDSEEPQRVADSVRKGTSHVMTPLRRWKLKPLVKE